MRFDLTVPFARYVAANKNSLYLPFKRYHISKVWRGENTQKGRYREFYQCDFDIVGVDSPAADLEILLLMKKSLQSLDIGKFRIHLSNRAVFNRFLLHNGIESKSAGILRTVDKLAKIGENNVLAMLEDIAGKENSINILNYIKPEKSFSETLEKITALAGGKDSDTQRLEIIHNAVCENGIEDYYFLDPSITRGLDYYTGVVFETFLTDLRQSDQYVQGEDTITLLPSIQKRSYPA